MFSAHENRTVVNFAPITVCEFIKRFRVVIFFRVRQKEAVILALD